MDHRSGVESNAKRLKQVRLIEKSEEKSFLNLQLTGLGTPPFTEFDPWTRKTLKAELD